MNDYHFLEREVVARIARYRREVEQDRLAGLAEGARYRPKPWCTFSTYAALLRLAILRLSSHRPSVASVEIRGR